MALQAIPAVGTVDRVVLCAAFPSGHAYLRELKALAGVHRQPHAHEDEEEVGINAAGYVMTEETVASIERMKKVAANLTNDDMVNITAYLASLPAPATVAYTANR